MIPFRKMNGLGNEFVVVDSRRRAHPLEPERVRSLSDRGNGIGFDQFIEIEPAREGDNHARMRITNADGGEVESCGNAARCVAALLLDETGERHVHIESDGGLMRAWRGTGATISVDMGEPRFIGWQIPIADIAADPQSLDIPGFSERFGRAACVNVGNPHAVFFVDDVEAVPLAEVGPALERHAIFPQRANISFVAAAGENAYRARVWERGVGATKACGTAACAIGALTHKTRRSGAEVMVHLPGGPLDISLSSGRIVMSGPYALDYVGSITHEGFVRDPLASV